MDSIGFGGDIGGSENAIYRPEDASLYDSTSLGDSLKNSLKTQTRQFSEFFKSALFEKDGYGIFFVFYKYTFCFTLTRPLHNIIRFFFCNFNF